MKELAVVGIGILSFMMCGAAALVFRLNLQRDAVFAFFALQAFAYLLVSPALTVLLESDKVTGNYPWFWTWTLLLYFPLLFASYGALVARLPGIAGIQLAYKSRRSVVLFGVVSISLLALYYARALSVGYFFRRIGSEEAAQLFASLGFGDLLLIKFHDMAAPAILLLSVVAIRERNAPGWMKIVGLVFAADVFTFAILNSRITLIAIFVFIGIMMLWTGLRPMRLFMRLVIVSPLFIYLMIVLINFRSGFLVGSTDFIAALNPFMASPGPSQATSHEWVDRVNCFDLIQIMSPALEQRGFPMGGAWYSPFISLFGPLIGSPEASALKAAGMTTSKAYMISHYTDMAAIDYQSCGLTDAYGNLGPGGFAVAGFANGIVMGMVTRALMTGGRGWKLLAVIIAAYYFMLFEQEFFNFAIGWIRVVPWVVILGAVIPIRYFDIVYRPMGMARKSEPDSERSPGATPV
ncbi:hypothetical protein [Paraburkholderia sp. GAS42]|uniref:hypothetical protein n=1 Tax=Paraburkholderia sp. GAS42 TaxID=3035135 RepID=UPI003D1F0FD7